MELDILQVTDIGLSLIIAAATIWIAFAANKISKSQLEMDIAKQKMDWCRACLQSMSKAVSLARHTPSEILPPDFELKRREIRAEIFALRNEGELFLLPSEGKLEDLDSLTALKCILSEMNGERFLPPEKEISEDQNRVRANIKKALENFRFSMRGQFGSVWSA